MVVAASVVIRGIALENWVVLRTTQVPSDSWSARESPLAAVEPFLVITASHSPAGMDPEIFFGSGYSVFFWCRYNWGFTLISVCFS